jgi:hypothetical protein
MKVIGTLFSFILVVCLSSVALAESQSASFEESVAAAASGWTNQSGSTMTLIFTPSSTQPGVYTLSGNYINNAAGFGCQGTPYPLAGVYYTNTLTLSFNVAWSNAHADCASVTGWTGFFNLSTTPISITTDWNLAYASSSGGAITSGSDVFTQTSVVKTESLISE